MKASQRITHAESEKVTHLQAHRCGGGKGYWPMRLRHCKCEGDRHQCSRYQNKDLKALS